MTETPTPRTKQHWAEAVAECVTDEQEALRLVGMYEEDEWPSAMLDIVRALLSTRRALTAEREARERAESERDAARAEAERLRGIIHDSYLTLPIPPEQMAFVDDVLTPHVRAIADEWAIRERQLAAEKAEVERLTQCLKRANDQAEHFEREWYLRGDEVERLREALRFYADPDTYKTHLQGGPEDPPDWICPIGEDCGQRARDAIDAARKESTKEERREAEERRSRLVDEYVSEYEYGDEGYVPTDDERAMLTDFAYGLVAHLDAAAKEGS